MNILYLAPTPFFSVRGTPIAIHDTIVHLTADGHDVDLLTFPFGEDREIPRLQITRCGGWLPIRSVPLGASIGKAALDLAMFLHLVWRLLIGRFGIGKSYDIVFALDESALSCWLLAWLLPCPVIYDMDSSIVEQFEASPRFKRLARLGQFAENRCVRVATVIVVQCRASAERVAAIDPHKHVVTIPDLPLVTEKKIQSAQPYSKEEGLHLKHPVFLYVGNLGFHQGVDLLIAAFDLLHREGLGSSLVIAGGQPEEVERMGTLHPNTQFLGTVEPQKLPGLYRDADVVVSPRRSGSNTPMKIHDYMLSGNPIVATDLPTHTQVLDEQCAILVEATAEGLADGMRRASSDQQNAADIARRARERVGSIISEEIFCERLRQVVAFASGTTDNETGRVKHST